MPQASTRIRTCPGPGCGISFSTISKAPPFWVIWTAFMVFVAVWVGMRSFFLTNFFLEYFFQSGHQRLVIRRAVVPCAINEEGRRPIDAAANAAGPVLLNTF